MRPTLGSEILRKWAISQVPLFTHAGFTSSNGLITPRCANHSSVVKPKSLLKFWQNWTEYVFANKISVNDFMNGHLAKSLYEGGASEER